MIGTDRFEAQIQEHMNPLKRYIRFRIANHADAEDVLQEVLLAAYRNVDTLKNDAQCKAWLIGIARNKCSDYFRKQAKYMELPIETLAETKLTVGMHGVTTRIAVRDSLEKLGDNDRQILYLSCFRNLRQEEIARILREDREREERVRSESNFIGEDGNPVVRVDLAQAKMMSNLKPEFHEEMTSDLKSVLENNLAVMTAGAPGSSGSSKGR